MNVSKLMVASVAMLTAFTAIAGSSPKIGGNATINATIGSSGVLNVGGGAGGSKVKASQAIASVLHGDIAGVLDINVTVGEAGVANVGGGAGGATVDVCQSIGTIGSDCGKKTSIF